MNNTKLDINQSYSNRLMETLKQQGLSENDINSIINGRYKEYLSSDELDSSVIFSDAEYSAISQAISEDYTFDEMSSKLGINPSKIDQFLKTLQENNLTVDNVKAFNRYSAGSNMILSAKRGVSRETIAQGIDSNLDSRLSKYGFSQDNITKIHEYINGLDYSKPLHENWENTTNYLEQYGISKKYMATINSAVMHKNSLAHLDETLSSLDQGLKTELPESIKLTRAIKSEYLTQQLQPGKDLTSLIGKKIEETGYSSTSPIYDASFAKYDDCNVVFDIYAPKGTQGVSIKPFSYYGDVEEEILLNSNDLYITDVIQDVLDKNGQTKTVLKSLLLSKDKTGYKDLSKIRRSVSDIDHATKHELKQMKEQLKQQEYDNYRDILNKAYMSEKDSSTFLHSSFTLRDGEHPKCDHYLEQINGQERKVLCQKSFDYDDKFQSDMLEKSIVDFAQRNPISKTSTQNSTNQNESNCNYRAISDTNNILSVNNVSPEYADKISNAVQQVEPSIYQQQVNQQAIMQQQVGGFQFTLSNGFINVFFLCLIIVLEVALIFSILFLIFYR